MKDFLAKVQASLKTNVHKTSFWVTLISLVAYVALQIISQVYNIDLTAHRDGLIFIVVQLVLIVLSVFGVITNHNVSYDDVKKNVDSDAVFINGVISAISSVESDVKDLQKAIDEKKKASTTTTTTVVPASTTTSTVKVEVLQPAQDK